MSKKTSFILLSTAMFFLFLFLAIFGQFFINQIFPASSLLPEINALREIVRQDSANNRMYLGKLDELQNKLKADKPDTAGINSILSGLRQSFAKDSREITSLQLISKIETGISKSSGESKESPIELLKLLFSWQVLAIFIVIAFIYFNVSASDIRKFFTGVKKLDILGTSVEFSDEVKLNTEAMFKEYRSQIKNLLDCQIQREQLNDKLRYVVEDIIESLVAETKCSKGDLKVRCTIHIPDVLFQETLYQLLDYYPRSPGGGSGRIKSTRFGIIGLAWRTENTKIRGDVNNNTKTLIENWGMDKSETTSNSKITAFAAVVLKSNNGTRLGVMYFDSIKENLFGDENSPEFEQRAIGFQEKAQAKCLEKGIGTSLENIKTSVNDKYLQIRIYE